MLLNFESLLCTEFGDRYAIRGGLSFSLQFARQGPRAQSPSAKDFSTVKVYIDNFRSGLSTDIQSDLSYSFKVFLVPKIGNQASKDSVAVEFVKYDPSKPEEMKQYERVVALIKPRTVQVANLGLMKPSDVVNKVAHAIGRPFKLHHHTLCYRHFSARPGKGASDPAACDTRYCIYDSVHRDYVYNSEWVTHLIKSLSDPPTYDFLFSKKLDLSGATGGGATLES
jgi:hypothetical protein